MKAKSLFLYLYAQFQKIALNKFSLLYMFSSSLLVLTLGHLEIIPLLTIDEGRETVSSFNIGTDSAHSQNFLLVSSATGNNKLQLFKLRVYNAKKDTILEKDLEEYLDLNQGFQFRNRFYYFCKKLFWIDFDKITIDSIHLQQDSYNALFLERTKYGDYITASYSSGVEIYDISNNKLVHSILLSEQVRRDRPQRYNNLIFYQNSETELAAYDLTSNKISWKFGTGKRPVSLFGIKVGSMPNIIGRYRMISEHGKPTLVMTTFAGDLFKFDPDNGNVLIKNERFKGMGNNAGLITKIALADINGDGIKDIVGTSVDDNIYCIDGKTLSIIWEYNTDNENQAPLALYDINNDSVPDVFSVNDKGKLSVIDGKTGSLLKEMQLEKDVKFLQSSVILADFNGDGNLDMIVKGGEHRIAVFQISSIQVQQNEIVWIPFQ